MMPKGRGPDVELGKRIKAARQRAGLTASALARLVGVTQGTISLYENGKSGISLEVLQRISAATGESLAEFFGGAPKSSYIAIDVGDGLLAGDESRWPAFMRGETPVYWPGTLKEFLSSPAAEYARVGPDEVPLLAKIAVGMNDAPLDDAGWMSLLAIVRTMTGGKGRPVLHEVVDAEDKPEG